MQNRLRQTTCYRQQFVVDPYRNNEQIQYLLQQNHSLHLRLSKLSQIESRIDSFIMRDQQNIREMELLRESLHEKACELEDVKRYYELEKHSYLQKQSALKKQIQSLVGQLKWIENDREENEIFTKKKLEEVKAISSREFQSQRSQNISKQNQLENQLTMMQETIKMLTFEAEEKDRENSGVRGCMMAEMERLVARNEQLAGENGCMKEEIEAMRMDLASLLCKEQELRQGNDRLEKEKLRNNQQRAQLMIDIKELERQLGASMRDAREMEEQILLRQGQLNNLSNLNKEIHRHCQDLQDQLRKKNRTIDNYNTQLTRQQSSHRHSTTQLTTQLLHLQAQLSSLSKQNSSLLETTQLLQHQSESKTVEIRDLLYAIEKLQEKLLSFESKCKMLENDKSFTAGKLECMGLERETEGFEIRAMREKILLKENHIRELQDMIEKQRLGRVMREKEVHQLRGNTGSTGNTLRKYEQEMLKMVRMFENQKVNMEQKFSEEKRRLKEMYEFQIRDTRDLFDRKIRIIQEQIQT